MEIIEIKEKVKSIQKVSELKSYMQMKKDLRKKVKDHLEILSNYFSQNNEDFDLDENISDDFDIDSVSNYGESEKDIKIAC